MGPTAAGKTQLAVELAAEFPIDVISVDSGQVYRDMNVGTAKPGAEILQVVPHKLIDIVSPWERYSAGQFCRDAHLEITRSFESGRIPFLVGGTMFYFKALEDGLSDFPQSSHEASQTLLRDAHQYGWPYMHARLMELDAESASEISPHDSQRILRLLELHSIEGQSPSELKRTRPSIPAPYRIVKIALVRNDRAQQNQLIGERFHQMLASGLIEEAEQLFQAPEFDLSLPSMRCVGYRQLWEYLSGRVDYDVMIKDSIRETCSVAKRQLTWIRNQANVIWVPSSDASSASKIMRLMNSFLP